MCRVAFPTITFDGLLRRVTLAQSKSDGSSDTFELNKLFIQCANNSVTITFMYMT